MQVKGILLPFTRRSFKPLCVAVRVRPCTAAELYYQLPSLTVTEYLHHSGYLLIQISPVSKSELGFAVMDTGIKPTPPRQ